jgi:hypothetical protein
VDRAHLARETRAKQSEDPRSLQQYAPEALHVLSVVRPVSETLIEGNGLRDFNRHALDPDRSSETNERGHDLLMEISPGPIATEELKRQMKQVVRPQI